MAKRIRMEAVGILILAALGCGACSKFRGGAPPAISSPAKMARVGAVDERFQSYNIEMVEVTGGRFWKPYGEQAAPGAGSQPSSAHRANQPVGLNPAMFQYRPPIDLSNPRLRALAAALGPAYVRVSGSWANTTYFQDSNAPPPKAPPKGFNGVLTRKEWKGVVDFAQAVSAKIVTSFATSAGTRNAAGVWSPNQARRLLAYTKSIGGSIAAAEFMNEPTYPAAAGVPKGYDAEDYGRDVKIFHRFVQQAAPHMLFLGPGSVGEGLSLGVPMKGLNSAALLGATGPVFDVFSYHFYGAVSERCKMLGPAGQTTPAAALSENWLSRADKVDEFYAALRDRFDPGKPLWITETADAACGGNPWASTFLDTFRYLDQHASLAQRGVKVIMHNTLASSDYGLLDQNTLAPRPNYWAALLWRKLMGATVLNPGPSPTPALHLYAQCLPGHPGGVTLLAINLDRAAPHAIELPFASDRYTLTARNLEDTAVMLNGNKLELSSSGGLPQLAGAPAAGRVVFAPASITFLAISGAGNGSCE